jgi:hypothetical protein
MKDLDNGTGMNDISDVADRLKLETPSFFRSLDLAISKHFPLTHFNVKKE